MIPRWFKKSTFFAFVQTTWKMYYAICTVCKNQTEGQIVGQRIRGGFSQWLRLWGISVVFGSGVSLRVHYRKRDEVYFTTLLWQNNGRQNSLISWMLFSELYKIIVNTVTLAGFTGGIAPVVPLGSASARIVMAPTKYFPGTKYILSTNNLSGESSISRT